MSRGRARREARKDQGTSEPLGGILRALLYLSLILLVFLLVLRWSPWNCLKLAHGKPWLKAPRFFDETEGIVFWAEGQGEELETNLGRGSFEAL